MLNAPIKIFLRDKNNYFQQGIRSVIEEYFSLHQVDVCITQDVTQYTSCQIAIIPFFYDECITPYYLHSYLKEHCPLTMLLIDEEHQRLLTRVSLCPNQHYLVRRQGVDQLLHLLDQLFRPAQQARGRTTYTANYKYQPKLTAREYDVVRYWTSGLKTTDISQKMGISSKTISTHKRNAMKKMNIRRNIELYHWASKTGLVQDLAYNY